MSKQRNAPRDFSRFIEFIRRRREEEGWSIREMEAAIGVGRTPLERWLSGKITTAPELDTLQALGKGLKVSLRFLLELLGYEVNGPELTPEAQERYRQELGLSPQRAAELAELTDDELDLLLEIVRMRSSTARKRRGGGDRAPE